MVNNTQIEECLVDLKFVGARGAIDHEESLFDRGVIDSLGIGTLIGLLSSRFGIVVPDEDLLPDNFDSVSSIAAYVNAKLESSGQLQV